MKNSQITTAVEGASSRAAQGSAYYPLPGDVYVGNYGAEVEVVAVAAGMVVMDTNGYGLATLTVEDFVGRAERSKAARRNTPNDSSSPTESA